MRHLDRKAIMAKVESAVQDHYKDDGLMERIFAFLEKIGIDPGNLTHEDLYACDQMHARGIAATREHVDYSGIAPGMRVLDLGCGIGGSSRYIRTARDCWVTGIDLTQEFIDVARELTERCGLGDGIEYFQANALDMPFEDASFDHVWSHNVTMNIEDKAGLVTEIARILKPGGRFSCSEIEQGPSGDPFYPLPWASEPTFSFLVTPDEMCALLSAGGLSVVEQIDLNEANLAFFREGRERAKSGKPPQNINPLAFKSRDDFLERVRNAGKSAEEGRLVEQLIIAEKS